MRKTIAAFIFFFIIGLISCSNNMPVSQINMVETTDGDKVSVFYADGCNIDDYFHSDKDGLQCIIEAISFGFPESNLPKYFTTDSVTIQKVIFLGVNEIGVQKYQIKARCSGLAIYATGEEAYLTGDVEIPFLYNGNGYAEYDISDIADKEIYDIFWREKMGL